MAWIVTYWKEIAIGVLVLLVLLQQFVIMRIRKGRRSELQPIINEVRKSIREHHLAQRKLFKDMDYLLSEIPAYIYSKVNVRREE